MTYPLATISEAALALGLNKSTVSRYVAANPELNRADSGPPKLVVAELRAHRAGHVNWAMAGNHAGLAADELDLAAKDGPGDGERGERHSPEPEPAAGRRAGAPTLPGLNRARLATETIKARNAQLDLEERLGITCERRLVEEAALELGLALHSELAARNRAIAETLAQMNDDRDIRALLDQSDRDLLERLSHALARKFGGDGGEEDVA